MIVVRIVMKVLPEKQMELIQTLLAIIGTAEKQAGCLNYALFCNMGDKNHLDLLGEWKTRKDLDHYLKSEMFSVLLGTKSLLNRPHDIHIYTVQLSEGMEAVNAIRS